MAKIHKVLAAFAERKGITLNQGSDVIYLKQNDIPVSIYYDAGSYGYTIGGVGAAFIVSVPLEADQWDKEKAKVLKEAMKKTAVVVFIKAKNVLEIHVGNALKMDITLDLLDKAVMILGEQFPQLGLMPKKDCFFCGQTDVDDIVENGKVYYPAHARCKKEHAYQLAKEIDDNILTGNYGPAILCALLGGIIGTIPSILVLIFADYLVAFLFALIPIAAYEGYKRGKGIMSKGTPVIIALVSVLCTVVLTAVTFYYQLFREFEEFPSFSEFMMIVLHPEIFPALVLQFLQALLFTAIGFVISWRIIGRNNKEKLARVKALHGSLDEEQSHNSPEQ